MVLNFFNKENLDATNQVKKLRSVVGSQKPIIKEVGITRSIATHWDADKIQTPQNLEIWKCSPRRNLDGVNSVHLQATAVPVSWQKEKQQARGCVSVAC